MRALPEEGESSLDGGRGVKEAPRSCCMGMKRLLARRAPWEK